MTRRWREAGLRVPFVGPDNRGGARMVGEALAARLSKGDAVAILEGIPTAFNAQQRRLGFEDAMGAAGMRIVSVQSGQWEQDKANAIAAALLREHPDLKAILASNDNMALGAAAAVRQAGRTGQVLVVGFDNIAAVRQLIDDGRVLGDGGPARRPAGGVRHRGGPEDSEEGSAARGPPDPRGSDHAPIGRAGQPGPTIARAALPSTSGRRPLSERGPRHDHPAPHDSWPVEGLRGAGARRRRPRPAGGRGARADGRQRRGQVDARAHPLRPDDGRSPAR